MGLLYAYAFPVRVIWTLKRENLSSELAYNKEAGQPAHPCRLSNTFVICLLESVSVNLKQHKQIFSS